ncbi:unnamed protein product, partial [Ostreobium quekettii]
MENLHGHFARASGAQMVLFSSVASLLGSPGQSNYGAANAGLDDAAESMQSSGLPVVSAQFGPWKGAGMATATAKKMEARGVGALTPEMGLYALASILDGYHRPSFGPRSGIVTATPFDWDAFLPQMPTVPGLFSHFSSRGAEPWGEPTVRKDMTEVMDVVGSMTPKDRQEFFVREVEQVVRSIMGSDVRGDQPLMAAGLDSLGAVELRNSLETRMGTELSSTLVFDYPTPEAIVGHLCDIFTPTMARSLPAARQMVPHLSSGKTGILGISAVAQKFPHGALEQGCFTDAVDVVPLSRWDADLVLTEDAPARFGSFLDSPYDFDATAFGVSCNEAVMIDPQQRLLLECVSEAVRSSRSADALQDVAGVGVFLGISTPDYSDLKKKHAPIGVYSATGSALSVAAGRVSYVLGMKGPAVSIDTACSSSLVSSHMARLDMMQGSCTASVASGVKLILTPDTTAMFNRAGMLTVDGRCKTLDARADGYVRGEAVACMVLHLVDRPPEWVCAYLVGSAVNQDGRSSTLTAPVGPAQKAVLRQALSSGGISPESVTALHTHGTGTALGDPIEVGAAMSLLVPTSAGRHTPLAFAAGKTSLGHTEPAAGVVGLVQAISSLGQRFTQPVLHLGSANPHMHGVLASAAGSILMPRAPGPAIQDAPTVSVSAFAFQGTNANIALQSGEGCTSEMAVHWDRCFHCLLPPPCAFTTRASVQMRSLVFESRLNRASLCGLLHHRVNGRGIFPGAGYLGFAASSLAAVFGKPGHGACVTNGVVSAPLFLQMKDMDQKSILCTVNLVTGALAITSMPGNAGDLLFAEPIARGTGFDAALNTLTSPGVAAATLSALTIGGRFVEISKRDIWSHARFAQERLDVSYHLVAVDFMPEGLLHTALMRVSRMLAEGILSPLQQIAYDIGSVSSALRQMSQARHVGKIVARSRTEKENGLGDVGISVVTGGAGMIGSLVAKWLARKAVKQIILTSRSGKMTSSAAEVLQKSNASYSSLVSIVSSDLSYCEDWLGVVDNNFASPRRCITALFHASGVLRDAAIANQNVQSIRVVFAPKVVGTKNVESGGWLQPTATHVFFSSVASLLGAPGQTNYGGANAFMDSTAERLVHAGLGALSIQWGAWAGAGMGSEHAITRERVESAGMALLTEDVGIASLEGLLSSQYHRAVASAIPFDWNKFLSRLDVVPPLLSEFSSTGTELHEDASLMESGLDSLGSVELRNALSRHFGIEFPATLTFDYPSVSLLSEYVASCVDPIEATHNAQAPAGGVTHVREGAHMIALTGISTRYANIDDLEGLHRCLADSPELHTVGPHSRWDCNVMYGSADEIPAVATNFGTFVDTAFHFDPDVFGISRRESAAMDPQQRILLEETLTALHARGGDIRSLTGSQTGVFVGCIFLEYADMLRKYGHGAGSNIVTGNGIAFMAGRISYTFGFQGPCVPTNTACSSSLVAAHMAARSVQDSDSSMALAAGANAILMPEGATAAMTNVRALAPDGRCKAFASDADGYGRGEGFTVAVLERKQALVSQAKAEAGIDTLEYVASHGTGTPLGDPIETGALGKAVVGGSQAPDAVFTMGAVKTLLGHTEGNAGL